MLGVCYVQDTHTMLGVYYVQDTHIMLGVYYVQDTHIMLGFCYVQDTHIMLGFCQVLHWSCYNDKRFFEQYICASYTYLSSLITIVKSTDTYFE